MPSLCYRDVHPCLPQRETNQSQHTCIALMQEACIEMNVAPINNNRPASGSEMTRYYTNNVGRLHAFIETQIDAGVVPQIIFCCSQASHGVIIVPPPSSWKFVTTDGEIITHVHRGSAMIHAGNQTIAHMVDEKILLAVYAMCQVLLIRRLPRTFNEACGKPLQL